METKTDNSYIKEKVLLRLEIVENIKKNEINVLEMFAGDGVIWKELEKLTNKTINILKIEKKANAKGVYLRGDNKKFIPMFDFSNFDVIDIDAYGIPIKQLKEVFKKKYKGYVIVTAIQTGMGRLPNDLLYSLGYSKEMIKKCQTLFSLNGIDKLKKFLGNNGVKKITGYFIDRKNYFHFLIN